MCLSSSYVSVCCLGTIDDHHCCGGGGQVWRSKFKWFFSFSRSIFLFKWLNFHPKWSTLQLDHQFRKTFRKRTFSGLCMSRNFRTCLTFYFKTFGRQWWLTVDLKSDLLMFGLHAVWNKFKSPTTKTSQTFAHNFENICNLTLKTWKNH